jgi:hypothetical protein
MQSLKSASVVLFACSIVACGGGESRWAGAVADSAGVTIVSNADVGLWTEADRWTVEEDLRIGVREGDPDYQFGEIVGITTDSRGRIFVVDRQAKHIKVFSPEGVYEQTIGGPGGGPGELAVPSFEPVIGAGDTLLVHDRRNRRVNRYAPDGSSAGSFRVVIQEGVAWKYRATSSGVIAEQLVYPARDDAENAMDAIVIRATDGTVTDTLMKLPTGQTVSSGRTVYHPEAAWDLTDDMQLLFGVNDEYRISTYSSAGELERIVTKQWERRPVSDRDREVLTTHLEALFLGQGRPPGAVARLLSQWQFSEFFPAFQTFRSGPAGSIWVQRVQPPSEMNEEEVGALELWWNEDEASAPDWDVFDSEGRYLGVVTMPRMFTPKIFRGDKIYGIWRDEFNVQYVVRLRIVGDLAVGAT